MFCLGSATIHSSAMAVSFQRTFFIVFAAGCVVAMIGVMAPREAPNVRIVAQVNALESS
jgi:hypothetical protein